MYIPRYCAINIRVVFEVHYFMRYIHLYRLHRKNAQTNTEYPFACNFDHNICRLRERSNILSLNDRGGKGDWLLE